MIVLFDGKGTSQTVTVTDTPTYFYGQETATTSYNVTVIPVDSQYPGITELLYDARVTTLLPASGSSINSVYLPGNQTALFTPGYKPSLFLVGTKTEAAIVKMSASATYNADSDLTILPVAVDLPFTVASYFDTTKHVTGWDFDFNWDSLLLSWWIGCWAPMTYWLSIACPLAPGQMPEGDGFTLSLGGQKTDTIAWDCSADDIQEALSGLSTVDSVTVTGGGTATDPFVITFTSPVNGVLTGGGGICIAWECNALEANLLNSGVNNLGQTPVNTPGGAAASVVTSPPGLDFWYGFWMTWSIPWKNPKGQTPIASDYCPSLDYLDDVSTGTGYYGYDYQAPQGAVESPTFNNIAGPAGVDPLGIAVAIQDESGDGPDYDSGEALPWTQTFEQTFTANGPPGWLTYYNLYGGNGTDPVSVTWQLAQGELDPNCAQCTRAAGNPCNVYQVPLQISWAGPVGNGSDSLAYTENAAQEASRSLSESAADGARLDARGKTEN